MREHRPEQRRARPGPARQMPPQHGDSRKLAGPGREDGVPEETDAERREHLREGRQRRRQGLVDGEVPGERPGEHGEEVQDDGDDDPAPADEVERVVDRVPLRPAPPEREDRRDERGENEEPARPGVARERLKRRHAAAFTRAPRGDALVDALQPRGDVRPPVALVRERACRRAHRSATRLVGEQAFDRLDERSRVAGRDRDGGLGRHDVAGSPRCRTRSRVSRTRTHGSAPCRSSHRRATARRAPSSSGGGR